MRIEKNSRGVFPKIVGDDGVEYRWSRGQTGFMDKHLQNGWSIAMQDDKYVIHNYGNDSFILLQKNIEDVLPAKTYNGFDIAIIDDYEVDLSYKFKNYSGNILQYIKAKSKRTANKVFGKHIFNYGKTIWDKWGEIEKDRVEDALREESRVLYKTNEALNSNGVTVVSSIKDNPKNRNQPDLRVGKQYYIVYGDTDFIVNHFRAMSDEYSDMAVFYWRKTPIKTRSNSFVGMYAIGLK